MTATTGIVLDPLPVSHTLSAISVTSTALTTGLIAYQVQTGASSITGTARDP